MKRCPRCNRVYSETDLNFCLDDGEVLSHYADEEPTRPLRRGDAPPPTIILDSPRVTNPIGWQAGQPIEPWRPPPHPAVGQQAQFTPYLIRSPNQTLAIVSMALGIGSITVGWCCYSGMALGPAALVTGFIALMQIKNNPDIYGGKPLAIVGMVTGAVYFVAIFVILAIYIAALIAGGVQ